MSAADEAREKLEGVTPGRWWWTNEIRQRLIAGGSPDDLAGAREIIRCAALLHPSPADAEFIAWCREGVPALVAELARANEIGEALAEASYRTGQDDLAEAIGLPRDTCEHDVRTIIRERDAALATLREVRVQVEQALVTAWDDGNVAGLDGWVGPARGTEPVDDEAAFYRDRHVRKALDKLAILDRGRDE